MIGKRERDARRKWLLLMLQSQEQPRRSTTGKQKVIGLKNFGGDESQCASNRRNYGADGSHSIILYTGNWATLGWAVVLWPLLYGGPVHYSHGRLELQRSLGRHLKQGFHLIWKTWIMWFKAASTCWKTTEVSNLSSMNSRIGRFDNIIVFKTFMLTSCRTRGARKFCISVTFLHSRINSFAS